MKASCRSCSGSSSGSPLEPPRTSSSCSLLLGPCSICGQRLLAVSNVAWVKSWTKGRKQGLWGPGFGLTGLKFWSPQTPQKVGQGTVSPECHGGRPRPPVPEDPPASAEAATGGLGSSQPHIEQGESGVEKSVRRGLALHTADPASIPSTPYGPRTARRHPLAQIQE